MLDNVDELILSKLGKNSRQDSKESGDPTYLETSYDNMK
jgi:hypothetical protein